MDDVSPIILTSRCKQVMSVQGDLRLGVKASAARASGAGAGAPGTRTSHSPWTPISHSMNTYLSLYEHVPLTLWTRTSHSLETYLSLSLDLSLTLRTGTSHSLNTYLSSSLDTYLSLSEVTLGFSTTGISTECLSFSLTKQWLFSIVCRCDLTIRPTSSLRYSLFASLNVLEGREPPQRTL